MVPRPRQTGSLLVTFECSWRIAALLNSPFRDAEWRVNYKQACVGLSVGNLLSNVLLITALMESQRFAMNITLEYVGRKHFCALAMLICIFLSPLALPGELVWELKPTLTQWISSFSWGEEEGGLKSERILISPRKKKKNPKFNDGFKRV